MAKVITDESQVPEGYVPLSRWGADKTTHKRLSDAHSDDRLPAVKLMRTTSEAQTGKVWVHEESAIRLLAEIESAKNARHDAATPKVPASVAEVPKIAGQIDHLVDMRISLSRSLAYLGDMYDVLEVIARATEATAKAVEDMATRPKQ
jgi:hypothetical protein